MDWLEVRKMKIYVTPHNYIVELGPSLSSMAGLENSRGRSYIVKGYWIHSYQNQTGY